MSKIEGSFDEYRDMIKELASNAMDTDYWPVEEFEDRDVGDRIRELVDGAYWQNYGLRLRVLEHTNHLDAYEYHKGVEKFNVEEESVNDALCAFAYYAILEDVEDQVRWNEKDPHPEMTPERLAGLCEFKRIYGSGWKQKIHEFNSGRYDSRAEHIAHLIRQIRNRVTGNAEELARYVTDE